MRTCACECSCLLRRQILWRTAQREGLARLELLREPKCSTARARRRSVHTACVVRCPCCAEAVRSMRIAVLGEPAAVTNARRHCTPHRRNVHTQARKPRQPRLPTASSAACAVGL